MNTLWVRLPLVNKFTCKPSRTKNSGPQTPLCPLTRICTYSLEFHSLLSNTENCIVSKLSPPLLTPSFSSHPSLSMSLTESTRDRDSGDIYGSHHHTPKKEPGSPRHSPITGLPRSQSYPSYLTGSLDRLLTPSSCLPLSIPTEGSPR